MKKLSKVFCAMLALMVLLSSAASALTSDQWYTLRRGDEGDRVKAVQRKLVKMGFLNDIVDSVYGKATEEAVRGFQKAYGLSGTGESDWETMSLMCDKAAQNYGGYGRWEKGTKAWLYEVNIAKGSEGRYCVVPSVLNTGSTDIVSIKFRMRLLNSKKKAIGALDTKKYDYSVCEDDDIYLSPGDYCNDLEGDWYGWHFNQYDGAEYVQVWIDSVVNADRKRVSIKGDKYIAPLEDYYVEYK